MSFKLCERMNSALRIGTKNAISYIQATNFTTKPANPNRSRTNLRLHEPNGMPRSLGHRFYVPKRRAAPKPVLGLGDVELEPIVHQKQDRMKNVLSLG